MTEYTVFIVAAVVTLFLLTELAVAVLPIVIVIVLVPPPERDSLARLVAACDSSHRLRMWPALRLAVEARRRERLRPPTGQPWSAVAGHPAADAATVIASPPVSAPLL